MSVLLITGATGNIGKKLRAHLGDRYALKLLDINGDDDPAVTVIDLSQWDERIVEQFTGVDCVVHLAADPDETKSWKELTAPNLDALNNVFVAAIKARVPRVVFASSNHVMGGYKGEKGSGRWLTTKLDPRPGTHLETLDPDRYDSTAYGAMKLFGERLGLCYSHSTGGVCIAIRLGWVYRLGQNQPEDLPPGADIWFKRMWLSTGDLCQLMEQSITVQMPGKSFVLLNGMSDNEEMVWDIEETKTQLRYNPKDSLK